MATAQKFDTLDGLVVTGTLETGGLTSSGNLTVDTNVLYVDTVNNRVGINKVPTVAFDVSGDVNIDGGTIDGLTQLSVDNLTLDSSTISSGTNALYLNTTGATGVVANTGGGGFYLRKTGTDYGSFLESSGSLVITAGSSSTTALTLQSDGDAFFAANVHMVNGDYLHLGANTLRGTNSGVQISANTYHAGHLVHSTTDTDTHIKFNNNEIVLTAGASAALTANSTVTYAAVEFRAPVIRATDYFSETVYDGGSGTSYVMNIANGSVHKFQPTGNYSIDFSNFPTSGAATFTLIINNNGTGREPTWPASGEGDKVYWAESVEPPHSSGVDIYSFYVVDGQIYGALGLRNAGFAN